MSLHVKSYKNYGKMMSSDTTKERYENFYFSFYHLSNDRVIELQCVEYIKNGKVKESDLFFHETKFELKNGKKINYFLGQDFFEWFNLSPPIIQIKNSTPPSKEEVMCVKKIFYDYVDKVREKKTDIISVTDL